MGIGVLPLRARSQSRRSSSRCNTAHSTTSDHQSSRFIDWCEISPRVFNNLSMSSMFLKAYSTRNNLSRRCVHRKRHVMGFLPVESSNGHLTNENTPFPARNHVPEGGRTIGGKELGVRGYRGTRLRDMRDSRDGRERRRAREVRDACRREERGERDGRDGTCLSGLFGLSGLPCWSDNKPIRRTKETRETK